MTATVPASPSQNPAEARRGRLDAPRLMLSPPPECRSGRSHFVEQREVSLVARRYERGDEY